MWAVAGACNGGWVARGCWGVGSRENSHQMKTLVLRDSRAEMNLARK